MLHPSPISQCSVVAMSTKLKQIKTVMETKLHMEAILFLFVFGCVFLPDENRTAKAEIAIRYGTVGKLRDDDKAAILKIENIERLLLAPQEVQVISAATSPLSDKLSLR
jgi:hypothetical protein